MGLPVAIDGIDQLPPRNYQEARWLIRCGSIIPSQPAVRRSNWARMPRHRASFWSETIRLRLAHQAERIGTEGSTSIIPRWPKGVCGRANGLASPGYGCLANS
jgi:hypothetical protein